MLGCDAYHLPKHIQAHVDYITPAVKTLELRTGSRGTSKTKKRSSSITKPQSKPMPFPVELTTGEDAVIPCFEAMTPQCIRSEYKAPYPIPIPAHFLS